MTYFSKKGNVLLAIITLVLVLIGLWAIIFVAPMIPQQEWAQRIFYYHVPLAWNAFLGYMGVLVFSIIYLVTRKSKWDIYALSAAEVGTVFCLLILITGPIWAKPIWGKAWTWEPRLTTTLILFLLYVGYFMIREFGGPYERSSRYAAVLGILAAIDIPLIYFAVDFWAPAVQSHPQRDMSAHSSMVLKIFFFSLFTYTLILINMFRYRVHVGKLELQKLEESHV
ncbi:MAG: cytochrome c biogenesis protein CcsA [Candidatus Marinimicrobia bacterium]|nr:cytochrome c biogenesis protein CcsA [Candidatus Neomarinimicrobiota bacterium]